MQNLSHFWDRFRTIFWKKWYFFKPKKIREIISGNFWRNCAVKQRMGRSILCLHSSAKRVLVQPTTNIEQQKINNLCFLFFVGFAGKYFFGLFGHVLGVLRSRNIGQMSIPFFILIETAKKQIMIFFARQFLGNLSHFWGRFRTIFWKKKYFFKPNPKKQLIK